MAFLETGAFIGLVAPGETTVIVGGLVAGQGVISLTILIAVVWTCAVAGDVTSYMLGRRLGRDFMVRHGARVKITEERLEQVERFFERRGGMTILIGRFIGLVRAIAPFVAGASHMPLRKFLPYDILGAGLWATTFCVLGFVFWRSFDQLTSWVSRGLFAFGLVVALIVGIVFLVRLQRNPELRARTARWIDAQLEKPLLRPVAPRAARRPGSGSCARRRAPPSGRRGSSGPHHAGRLRPRAHDAARRRRGRLVRLLPARGHARRARPAPGRPARRRHRRADRHPGGRAASPRSLSVFASLPVVALIVAVTTGWAFVRRRFHEAAVLPLGLALTWLAVEIARAWSTAPARPTRSSRRPARRTRRPTPRTPSSTSRARSCSSVPAAGWRPASRS